MKIQIFVKGVLLLALLSSLNACNGNSDKDGNKSIEGHSDPANTGGKLSGDHGNDQSSGVSDSTKAVGK